MYEKTVIRFNDGRIVRGWVEDFDPDRERVVLMPPADPEREVLVQLRDVKAIFFVRSFYGDPTRVERQGFLAQEFESKAKLLVEFKDGERLWGWANNEAPPTNAGNFFVTPADESSNNEKVYVKSGGLASVEMV